MLVDSLIVQTQDQVDTLSLIDAGKVANFYSSLLDNQSAQFTLLISVLLGIVVVIIGATWWWNYRGAKQQISEEIDKQKITMMRLFKVSSGNMEKDIAKSIKEEMEVFSNSLHKEFEDYKLTVSKNINKQQAELSRVFALHCETTGSFFTSATWWFAAAELYKECDDQEFSQISVDAGVDALKNSINKESLGGEVVEKIDVILKRIDTLPDYFASQKRETRKLVAQIKKAIKEKESSNG